MATAGAGKTFLTSMAIDDAISALQGGSNHEGLAFFYCNRTEAERRDPLSVLRSFLRQLSTTANDKNLLQTRLRDLHLQLRSNGSSLTRDLCKSLILDLVNLYPRTTIILDALDECDQVEREFLVETFENLLRDAVNPVKIFISSRPDGDIKDSLQSYSNITIQASDNDDDIATFVRGEIVRHRRWSRISAELRDEVVGTLLTRSQGM
jgi:ankyrin repeat domain-containing protein 50